MIHRPGEVGVGEVLGVDREADMVKFGHWMRAGNRVLHEGNTEKAGEHNVRILEYEKYIYTFPNYFRSHFGSQLRPFGPACTAE